MPDNFPIHYTISKDHTGRADELGDLSILLPEKSIKDSRAQIRRREPATELTTISDREGSQQENSDSPRDRTDLEPAETTITRPNRFERHTENRRHTTARDRGSSFPYDKTAHQERVTDLKCYWPRNRSNCPSPSESRVREDQPRLSYTNQIVPLMDEAESPESETVLIPIPSSKEYSRSQASATSQQTMEQFETPGSKVDDGTKWHPSHRESISRFKRPVDGVGYPLDRPQKRQHGYLDLDHVETDDDLSKPLSDAPEEVNDNELAHRISQLKSEIKTLEALRSKLLPQKWRVVYRVYRARSLAEGGYVVKHYLDQPRWYGGIDGHEPLAGTEPILDIKSYLDRHTELGFVVFRDYGKETPDGKHFSTVGEAHQRSTEEGYPLPSSESTAFVFPELQAAMESYIRTLPDNNGIPFPPGRRWPQQLDAPYLPIYHHRLRFRAMTNLLPESIRKLWKMFSDYVEQGFGPEYSEVDCLFQQGMVCPRFLKYLIKPGDILYCPDHAVVDAVQALTSLQEASKFEESHYLHPRAETAAEEENKDAAFQRRSGTHPQIAWSIEVTYWSFNVSFKRVRQRLHLEMRAAIDETVAITSLKFYPVQRACADTQRRLHDRGISFWKCRSRRYVEYSKDTGVHAWSSIKSRYMIDPLTYLRMHGDDNSEEELTASVDLSAQVFAREECPDYPFPMLLPSKIHGYHFIEKRWVDLEVEYIADVQWNTKAFENLVTEEETKDLLEALVKNQLKIETSTDLIAGKGNGLIILLHGGPGTGKTYTAESVADYARKPLYRVTCGDIGTEPVEVEKYLETVLRLGRIWSCVVLLDEADIFLEERTLADLKRNALVSVFLRVLEYYNGILILTSNRVGHFDEAFKSRIQLSLHYESLDQRQRHQIWTNFIKHLRSSGSCKMDFDDLVLHIHDLSQYEMNGRQIRNAITTARQLAEFRKKDLNYEIITKVIRVAGKFDRYLQGVKKAEMLKGGTVDEQIARDAGTR